jgi:hypothetical protein
MGHYDVAQVCPNGHIANAATRQFPQFNKSFCERCGEKTLTQCPKCNSPIRGDYSEGLGHYSLPFFCNACGAAFPWVELKTRAAIEMFIDETGATGEQAAEFERSVNDVAKNTPAAQLGASRIVRALKSISTGTASAIRSLVVEIASETAKKVILSGSPPGS